MIEIIDKTAERNGTKINRKTLMAMQGFIGCTIQFNDDGSIVETNTEGQTKTTKFENGSIIETFVGEKTIKKITTFNADGSISEVIL